MKRTLYYTILICVTISCIVTGCVLHAIHWGSRLNLFFKNEGTKTVSRDYTVTDAFDSVQMELGLGDVEIESGSAFSADWKGPSDLAPEINNIHGALVITQNTDLFHSQTLTGKKKLTITLPKGQVYNDFKVALDMGNCEIEDISAKNAEIDLKMGNLKFKDAVCDTLNVDAAMGNVEIDGLKAKNAAFSVDAGNIDVSDMGTFESLSVDANMGNVKLDLDMKLADLTISSDSDLGSVTVNGNKLTDSSLGSGPAKLSVNADLGSVKIHTDD
ncbi:MAG: DUF4097 family beta strand repeat protein [Lachnospiraceae bacterium]|nr:DUF4097 family beta strand repeat protein [Lachnospiraceae bacterium]